MNNQIKTKQNKWLPQVDSEVNICIDLFMTSIPWDSKMLVLLQGPSEGAESLLECRVCSSWKALSLSRHTVSLFWENTKSHWNTHFRRWISSMTCQFYLNEAFQRERENAAKKREAEIRTDREYSSESAWVTGSRFYSAYSILLFPNFTCWANKIPMPPFPFFHFLFSLLI